MGHFFAGNGASARSRRALEQWPDLDHALCDGARRARDQLDRLLLQRAVRGGVRPAVDRDVVRVAREVRVLGLGRGEPGEQVVPQLPVLVTRTSSIVTLLEVTLIEPVTSLCEMT